MESIFLKLLNMSITASWIAIAVMVFRLIFKKAPKAISVAMWSLVGIRLIFPISFESAFSLIPSTKPIPEDIVYSQKPAIDSGVEVINNVVNPVLTQNFTPTVGASVNPLQVVNYVASFVWIIGVIAMLVYVLISYLKIHRQVREAVSLRDNIMICDRVETPFMFGVIRPKIYLPSGMDFSDADYVIAHENAHLQRHDHWWKPLGFLLLAVYWFNPVLWVAYILLCKDIEIACDEKVLKTMGTQVKKPYSNALINCSVSQKMIAACPLAFGEVSVKERVKNVLNYKKPAFWIVIIAVIVCAVVCTGFMTNPKTELVSSNPELDKAISQMILDQKEELNWLGECPAEGHIVYAVEENDKTATAYAKINFASFGFKNGCFCEVGFSEDLAVIKFRKNENGYEFKSIKTAEDGDGLRRSVEKMFPEKYVDIALSTNKSENADLWKQLSVYANNYLEKIGRSAKICTYSDIPSITLSDLGISVDASNKIYEHKLSYDTHVIGTTEILDNGVRYIKRTSYLSDRNIVLYTTEEYDTGKIIETIKLDGKTGDILSNDNHTYWRFDATVLKKEGNRVLVKPVNGSNESKSSGEIWVSLNSLKDSQTPNLYDGLHVCVVYDGKIEETSPASINGTVDIYLMGDIYYYGNEKVANKPAEPSTTSISIG